MKNIYLSFVLLLSSCVKEAPDGVIFATCHAPCKMLVEVDGLYYSSTMLRAKHENDKWNVIIANGNYKQRFQSLSKPNIIYR